MLTLLLLCAQVAPGAAAYDPEGVHVDAQAVLRARTVEPDSRLAKLWADAKANPKSSKLLQLSLVKLFADARALLDAGKPLTDEIRYLGGMTKLQYVFFYPKDIVIVGPAEPFDATASYRPLGRITGRPVLHIDDVVVAIRAFSKAKPDRIGCDIELTKEVQQRVSEKIKAVAPKVGSLGFKKACEQIAEAGGGQPVKYYGIDPETRYAFVCVEADYRLKQLALGVLPTPVAKVVSYKALLDEPEAAHRFSLESDYEALLVSSDGNAFEIRGPSLRVKTGVLGKPDAQPSAAAQKFAQLCNEHWTALTRSLVEWADLSNLGDLAILGALVAEKAPIDLAWFPVKKIAAPKSAQTVCSYMSAGRSVIFIAGGVWIKSEAKRVVQDAVVEREAVPEHKDKGKLGTGAYKPREKEKAFYDKLEKSERVTGSMLEDYDIRGKKGKFVSWFGIVREVKEGELLLEHKYFDGLTDTHIMALSMYGSGDFKATVKGKFDIETLVLVRVYGTVVDEGVVQADYIRVFPWKAFTFLMCYGTDRRNEKWKKLCTVTDDDIYDPWPDDDYYVKRLGARK